PLGPPLVPYSTLFRSVAPGLGRPVAAAAPARLGRVGLHHIVAQPVDDLVAVLRLRHSPRRDRHRRPRPARAALARRGRRAALLLDRKSTRLNSSHEWT